MSRNVNFLEQPHASSNIKKVIGVVSGKGGVGKSLVTSMLAVTMNRLGYNSAVLDADVTGPSIPKVFGLTDRAKGTDDGILTNKSKTGIDIMSVNLLLKKETDPVMWRGPIITSTIKQFWTDVMWGNVDFMFIDMPPGTGEVALTVFQSIPVDGIVVVTSPQELVSMIVAKAVRMAEMMGIPIIGLVENMAYFQCDDCGKEHKIFGESHIDEIAKDHNLEVLAKLPIMPEIAQLCDQGRIEDFNGTWLNDTAIVLEKMLLKG
ncbi:MAG TPA: P-loop NTPase [Tissierellaceae bacterium]|nr:P-loop NTPase [Tissierellaceae bacterium]